MRVCCCYYNSTALLYIPCPLSIKHAVFPAPVSNNHRPTGRANSDKCIPLLKLIQKKGLLGFTREMREQLADALGAEVLDQDLIENLPVAAFMRHLEICSKGGRIIVSARLVLDRATQKQFSVLVT